MTATRAMTRTTDPESPGPDHAPGGSEPSAVERLERSVEGWRAHIDGILLRANPASEDVVEATRSQAAIAENVYLAVKSRLLIFPEDACADVDSARADIDKLVGDICNAYEAAEARIRRSPAIRQRVAARCR